MSDQVVAGTHYNHVRPHSSLNYRTPVEFRQHYEITQGATLTYQVVRNTGGRSELLKRVLPGTRSPLASAIASQRALLCEHVSHAIRELHWKDFETLADLVFRDAGWILVSVLRQHAKAYDLELRELLAPE